MSRKQISNRLDKLFGDIKEEEKALNLPRQKTESNRTQKLPKLDRTLSPALQKKTKSENLNIQVDATDSYATMSLPLRMDTATWGTLQIVSDTTDRNWDIEEQMLVQQVTDQLTLALENARLFQETQRRTEELALVNKIVTEISLSLDLQKNLQLIAKEVAEISAALYVGVSLLNEEKTHLIITTSYPEATKDIGLKIILENNPTCTQVIETRQPASVQNIQSNPFAISIKNMMKTRTPESLTIFPLLAGSEVIGTLSVELEEPSATLSQNQIDLIQTILLQVSTSVETARLFQETQESETEFRALFAAMEDVIFVVDKDTRYLRIAPTNPSGLYLEAKELLGKRMDEILPKETHSLFHDAINQALTGNETVNIDYPLEINKQKRWFHASLSKLGEDQVYWIARDITERKEAELQIQQLGNAVEQSLDGMVIASMDNRIQFVNYAWSKMHGYASTDELIGKPLSIFYSEEQLQYEVKLFNQVVKAEGANQGEIEHKRQDGSTFPTWMTVTVLKSEDNTPIALVASVQDITERKKNEQILRRQNEYMAAAAEVGRLVTSTLDLGVLFRRSVNLLREHFGYYHAAIFTIDEDSSDAVVREATGVAGAEMKKRKHTLSVGSKSIVGTATKTGKPYIVNDVTKNPIHHINPLLPDTKAEAAIPLIIERQIIGALDLQATKIDAFSKEDVVVLQLLADQFATAIANARSYKLAQDAFAEVSELERLKSQFLANMSHELRTPLNSIIGFSRVILKGIDGPVSDMQQQDLTAIYNSGQHLLGLINDILDLSKIEAGKMELTFDKVDIEKLIKSVMSTVVGLIKDKPVRLEDEIEPNLPAVKADSMRVRQILINFFSNAAKFTDEGTIKVTAKNEGKYVRISVIDSGPGISEKDQEKLFQAFSQVDASTTRATGGSGLGLSISKELVTMHGGEIGLSSKIGKGSTFYFTLPFFDSPTPMPEQEIKTKTAEELNGDLVILSVENDEKVINLYQRYLNTQGYQVVPLTDAKKTVERAKELKPYAITLDVMMLDYDGWQVLEELKADPETQDIPVIICSIVEDSEKGYALGATDYLLKPIIESDLLESLNRINPSGRIHDVLIIDDNPDDLRLVENIFTESKKYNPIIANSGPAGWEKIINNPPQAIILDLYMPEMDGFQIIDAMQASVEFKDIPVIVASNGDISIAQQKKLDSLNYHFLKKGALYPKELLATLERSLMHKGKNK